VGPPTVGSIRRAGGDPGSPFGAAKPSQTLAVWLGSSPWSSRAEDPFPALAILGLICNLRGHPRDAGGWEVSTSRLSGAICGGIPTSDGTSSAWPFISRLTLMSSDPSRPKGTPTFICLRPIQASQLLPARLGEIHSRIHHERPLPWMSAPCPRPLWSSPGPISWLLLPRPLAGPKLVKSDTLFYCSEKLNRTVNLVVIQLMCFDEYQLDESCVIYINVTKWCAFIKKTYFSCYMIKQWLNN